MWETLYQSLLQLTWLEGIGFLSGIAYVVLAARANRWCWPVGLINVIAFFLISIHTTMYADMLLQIVYFVLTLYGWHTWQQSKTSTAVELPISRMPRQYWLPIVGVVALGTPLIAQILANYTNTDVPYGDAFTTILSLIATWQTARKWLENWWLWLIADPIYVVIYNHKGWYLSAALFGIYTLVAFVGYLHWQQTLKNAIYSTKK